MEEFEGVLKEVSEPVAYLKSKYTHISISVYRKMNYFTRIMINLFFGFKYENIK